MACGRGGPPSDYRPERVWHDECAHGGGAPPFFVNVVIPWELAANFVKRCDSKGLGSQSTGFRRVVGQETAVQRRGERFERENAEEETSTSGREMPEPTGNMRKDSILLSG